MRATAKPKVSGLDLITIYLPYPFVILRFRILTWHSLALLKNPSLMIVGLSFSLSTSKSLKTKTTAFKTSIQAKLMAGQLHVRCAVGGDVVTYFLPMQARGPVENGMKYSMRWLASGSSHLSGLNSVGDLNMVGSIRMPQVGTLTIVFRRC